MAFRENLKEAIDFSGLQQKELAHQTKINLRSIEKYLQKDGSIPSADRAVKIAQVLGVTVEYLVTGKEIQERHPTVVDSEIFQLMYLIRNMQKEKRQKVLKIVKHLVEIL